MPDNILVPMDDSELAEQALEYAVENNPESTLTLVHAYGMEKGPGRGSVMFVDDEALEAAREHATTIFDKAEQLASKAGHEGDIETVAEEGDPEKVISKHAEDADAVIMGSHAREGTSRVLLGSVAEKVVRRAPVPVTVVK
jgi:nucleotide-binding universal stress UspA family protein